MNRILLVILISGLSANAQHILVPPYVQPGNAATLSKEQKVVIWQTDSIPGNFRVDFAAGASLEHAKKLSVAKVTSVQLKLLGKTSFLYRATLTGLLFDTEYAYRVSLDAAVISATTFTLEGAALGDTIASRDSTRTCRTFVPTCTSKRVLPARVA